MPTVILARHGRTAANAAGTLAGRSAGVGLDETGRAQASAAAERIAEVPLAAAVTSPLQRCRETARVLVGGRGPALIRDARLQECDYGSWTGRRIQDLAKEPLWRTVQGQPSAVRFPGGESLPEMAARAVGAVRDRDAAVAAEHGDDAVWLAVSHGDVIKAILADALGSHLDAFQRIVVDPGSLSVVRYTPAHTFVLTVNSTAGSLGQTLGHSPGRLRGRPAEAVPGGGAGPGGDA